jgi:cell shape-determining protein MreC
MPRAPRRSRCEIAIIVLLVVSVALIALDRRGHLAAQVRSQAAHVFSPSQSWLKNFTLSLVGGGAPARPRGRSVQDEIQRLRTDLQGAEAELQVAEMDNARLAALRDDLKKQINEVEQIVSGLSDYPLKLVPANILSRQYLLPEGGLKIDTGRRKGAAQGHWVLHPFLSRGKTAGVRTGDPVLSGKGLVGIIESSATDYSQVRLVTSKKCVLPARIMHWDAESGWVRQGGLGFIRGTGDGKTLALEQILSGTQVAPGDYVITAASETGLPDYLIIGEVTEVSFLPVDGTLRILVRPRVNLDRLDRVYVLSPRGPSS